MLYDVINRHVLVYLNDISVYRCKGCDPYGQLLCEMLQVPGAVHTLHTHSMVVHRRRTSVYNTPVATKWLGQRLYYSLVQTIGYG